MINSLSVEGNRQQIYTECMIDEMRWEGTRGKHQWKRKTNERLARQRQRKRDETDSERFPDFGRKCGKSEKENPLINRQLQHIQLDLLQGVIFLFSNLASFLPQLCGGKPESMTSVNSFLFLTNWKLKRTSPESHV